VECTLAVLLWVSAVLLSSRVTHQLCLTDTGQLTLISQPIQRPFHTACRLLKLTPSCIQACPASWNLGSAAIFKAAERVNRWEKIGHHHWMLHVTVELMEDLFGERYDYLWWSSTREFKTGYGIC